MVSVVEEVPDLDRVVAALAVVLRRLLFVVIAAQDLLFFLLLVSLYSVKNSIRSLNAYFFYFTSYISYFQKFSHLIHVFFSQLCVSAELKQHILLPTALAMMPISCTNNARLYNMRFLYHEINSILFSSININSS